MTGPASEPGSELPVTPSFRLDGRRALVTGASRGIGRAAAVALARAGASVVLAARSGEELGRTCEALNAEGHAAEALVLDVADVDAARAAIVERGPFRILVNNAGLNRPGPMRDATPEDFDAVMGLNVRAAYFVAQAVLAGMVAAGKGGSIVNTSSQMGLVGGIDRTLYCASKFAVEGLTRAMAIEAGRHGVRVNTVCPTFVRTPLTASTFADPERVAWIESKIELGRIAEVEDLMGPVVFLASDAAAMITGSSLVVDGGWTAS